MASELDPEGVASRTLLQAADFNNARVLENGKGHVYDAAGAPCSKHIRSQWFGPADHRKGAAQPEAQADGCGYEGTVSQFTGDGVMALFGAPVAHEDHVQRASRAALSIQKGIGEYGTGIEKDCGVEFKLRTGLNSVPLIVGSIGDDLRVDYTAVVYCRKVGRPLSGCPV